VQLVISDQHCGRVTALKRSFECSAHQQCRVHFARNLLAHVPKTHADMVAAVVRTIFAQPDPEAVSHAWGEVRDQPATLFPKVGSLPPLERVNKAARCGCRELGPAGAAQVHHSQVMISERPAEVDDRAMPGHWEGDLIIGLNSSAIGTRVERTTRFTMLLHLPPMEGHGAGARTKNGPALAGHGAEAVKDAIASQFTTLPTPLRNSLTWNQGAEMARHAQIRIDTGLAIYFCDPRSPW
jgi:hypothetical protein